MDVYEDSIFYESLIVDVAFETEELAVEALIGSGHTENEFGEFTYKNEDTFTVSEIVEINSI